MKYISFLIILCILLTGCGKEEKISKEVQTYQNIVKGIVLVGYLKTSKNPKEYHDTFRLYLNYQDKNHKTKTVYYEKKIWQI